MNLSDIARFAPHKAQPLSRFAAIDAQGIVDTIQRAMASARLDTETDLMKNVNETIRRALGSVGTAPASQVHADAIDAEARVIEPVHREGRPSVRKPAPALPGEFVTRSYTNAVGTRAYKLYVPKRYAGEPVPLVVMLHGCTQNPDDFAAGTQMNELAERDGFLVVYPAQSKSANGSNCWNWFKSQDQARGSGEPSLIAGITREVAANYRVDEKQIFVTGLSAGAAMAVILGATYPELYAAVGAHSGLPFGAAHDMPSAFAAMHGRGGTVPGAAQAKPDIPFVPTIVFHGDRDTTVGCGNGIGIIEQAAAAAATKVSLTKSSAERTAASGRDFSRTVYSDAAGRPQLEQWVLHGAGHAWSGGSHAGSYTDAQGPGASEEMLRFFMAQRAMQPVPDSNSSAKKAST